MSDRKNLISDFEYAVRKADAEGWDFVDLTTEDGFEILDMLKAQEPRVLTLEEIKKLQSLRDGAVWLETLGGVVYPALPEMSLSNVTYLVALPLKDYGGCLSNEYYGKTWRCWSARPTDEQKEATPWME